MKVTTQAELDSALADAAIREIIIDSPSSVWLRLDSNGKGSSRVVAWGSSRVEACKYVAIHLHSKRVTLTGEGVVIDVTAIDTNRVPDFIDYHGVAVEDGWATVYKAVDDDLISGYGFKYPIGETVTAPNWRPSPACGHGLHFGFRPAVAKGYFGGATRFLECRVKVAGLIALGDKVKSSSCFVVREVDIHGTPVERGVN